MTRFLWAIFGNDEEWPPPSWYYERHWSGYSDLWVKAMWLFVRNPLHNLTWHVLGFVGEMDEWTKEGKYPNDVWNPNGGWNRITYTHRQTGRRRVFRSYRGRWVEFYAGPRERGNYGAALRRARS